MSRVVLLAFASLLITPGLSAAEDWTVKSDIQGVYGDYSNSSQRNSFVSGGVFVAADYLDQGGFSLGAAYSRVNYKVGDDINQQSYFGSVRYNIFADALPGKLSLRVDGHLINNDDATGDTGKVKAVAPVISFINFSKTIYADFGFTYSRYQNNLTVKQYTPTLGFGLNDGADWIQLRGYLIDPSNALRAQNKSTTSAVDIKYTHWFAPDAWLAIHSIQLNVLAGERIYAVDGDAAAVYNLADIQRGSYSLGLQWRVGENMKLLLIGGYERYLNNLISETYNNRFAYFNISSEW
jgi:hypothetical protein